MLINVIAYWWSLRSDDLNSCRETGRRNTLYSLGERYNRYSVWNVRWATNKIKIISQSLKVIFVKSTFRAPFQIKGRLNCIRCLEVVETVMYIMCACLRTLVSSSSHNFKFLSLHKLSTQLYLSSVDLKFALFDFSIDSTLISISSKH